MFPQIGVSIYVSIYLSIYLSIHPSIYLSIYLSYGELHAQVGQDEPAGCEPIDDKPAITMEACDQIFDYMLSCEFKIF